MAAPSPYWMRWQNIRPRRGIDIDLAQHGPPGGKGTPNWDDFVDLVFSEIRACGANNLQIVRRSRAMIENLKETLPTHRQDELQHQMSLLDREAKRLFRYPEELALAMIADSQGLGAFE